MLKHAREYGGNPRRVFVAGHSAGGHPPAMVAMDKRLLAKYGAKPDDPPASSPFPVRWWLHHTIRQERGLPKMTMSGIDDAVDPPIKRERRRRRCSCWMLTTT